MALSCWCKCSNYKSGRLPLLLVALIILRITSETYSLDYEVSNQLEIIDGKLTGKVLGKVVDAQYKKETLEMLGEKYQIPASQWVAVGDGANDLLMLKTATLVVALHAKPKVQEQAKFVVNSADLTAILLLLNAKTIFDKLRGK